MNITSVTVGLTRTESLPGYSNIRPSLSLTAQIEPGEDWAYIRAQLTDEVKSWVENYIDIELEKAGQPAKFSQEARFDLLWWQQGKIALIAPHDFPRKSLPGYWTIFHNLDALPEEDCFSNQRLAHLLNRARNLNLSDLRDFSADTPEAIQGWVATYLALSATWSIVVISVGSPEDENWMTLGRVAVPGDVYEGLAQDDSLTIKLYQHPGVVGWRKDIEKIADELEIPIIGKWDYISSWITERIEGLQQEQQNDAVHPF